MVRRFGWVTLALAAGLGSNEALAQPADRPLLIGPISFGPIAGSTISSFERDLFPNRSLRAGLAVGGFARVELDRHWTLEAQGLFLQKGWGRNGGPFGQRVSYLEFPALITGRSRSGRGGVSPFLQLGPAIAFKLDCKIKGGIQWFSCDDEIRPIDFSAILGAGLDLGRLRITARYELGLTRLDSSTDPNDFKNRSFVILMGYGFHTPH